MRVKLRIADTSGTYAPTGTATFLSFSAGGKDSLDMYDIELTNAASAHQYCTPYTLSAENRLLGSFDNRDFFMAPKTVPFGIYSNYASNITFTAESLGSVPDYNDSVWNEEVGNIYLKDLGTGVMHDMFGDTVTLAVPADTAPTPAFELHLFPALRITTTTESCTGFGDGSMHILNPGSTNWILLVSGPTGNFSTPVTQTDTLLDLLPAGTYSLAAFTDGVLSDERTITITSAGTIAPSFTASTTTESQGININFTNTTAGSYSWTWSMDDGTFYTTSDVSHAYANAGTYVVTLTATDSTGCTGSATETITINLLPPSAPPQFWNPGNTSNHNSSHITKRNPDLTQREGNTLIVTQHEDASVAEIKVYTMNGQLVTSQMPNATVTEIPLTQSGGYLVVMTMTNGDVQSKKIVLGM